MNFFKSLQFLIILVIIQRNAQYGNAQYESGKDIYLSFQYPDRVLSRQPTGG